MNVSIFATCLVDQFYPNVAEAAARLLHACGARLDFPERQTCCGQPAFNSGYSAAARDVALNTLDTFEQSDYVVCPSGSCAGMIAHYYPELFRDDADNLPRALALKAKTFELSQFLVHVAGCASTGGTFRHSVAYHSACHGLRLLGLRGEAETLLRGVSGIELREIRDGDDCCGFGGTFAVKMAPISEAMVESKAQNILAAGAEVLVSGDMGCLANIGGWLKRRGHPIRVMHLAELLWEAKSNG